MLIASTPKERSLQVTDAPLFPFFLPLSPEFPISKRHQPCHGVGLAHFLPSPKRGGGNQKATAAGKSARALGASSARVSCCFFKPHFPLRRAHREESASDNTGVCEGTQKPADAGDPGAQPVSPPPGGGKAASRAHRPAPSSPLPAARTLLILLGSARRGPNV